jgi:hypothetical protein
MNALKWVPSLLVLPMLASPALAQYSVNPGNADETDPGIKYFGSAKDDRGALLPGVTIKIARYLILVTDEQGRYRGNVVDLFKGAIPITCSKPGYTVVRINKRPGPPGGLKQTFEADCILRKK